MDTEILIRTKLDKPRLVGDVLERPGLLKKLDQGLNRRLTLVAAPAGYGKSTLISAWLETEPRPAAWVSLDEQDDNLTDFLNYFIAAVRNVAPDACSKTLDLLSAAETPPLRVLSASLINDLDAIVQPFILALDDYHFIRDMAVHDLLNNLIRHQPQTLHLVLISRLNPPLDLVRLRSRGQVSEIRMLDLRFSRAETAAFIQKSTGFEIDVSTTDILQQKCEGWITALRLATLSARDQADFERILMGLQGETADVRDYLLSEVISRLSPVLQEFLLKTSILNRLSGSLCDAVVELDEPVCNGQAHLEWIHQTNLFLMPLDPERCWYRYHHLFRDLLQNRLEREFGRDSIRRLHNRASAWFAQNNLIDEALQHALAAEDIDTATLLVEQYARKLLDQDQWHKLEMWMAQLPDEALQRRPELLLAKAWEAFHQFALGAIPPLLESTERILHGDDHHQPLWGEVDFFWGHRWYWHGQNKCSLALLSRALERIPRTHHLARGEAELFWGLAKQMSGQKAEAIERLYRWLDYDQTRHPGRQTKLLGSLIFIHLLSGELDEATLVNRQARALADQHSIPYIQAWSSYLQGCINYNRNELENALPFFAHAADNRYVLHKRAAVDSLVGLAFTCQALGQRDDAMTIGSDLLEFARESNDPAYITIARSCRARLFLLQDDLTAATRELRAADLSTDVGIMFYWLETPRLTECQALIAHGAVTSLKAATDYLRSYAQACEAAHNICQLIRIRALQSLTYLQMGHDEEALVCLEQAVILAEPGGWVRPLLELGPEVINLLQDLGRKGRAQKHVAKILAAASPFLAVSPEIDQTQFPDPLTDRELEVLELLAQRYRNKEIAAELFIAPTTVKRHASNIYQKLQVSGRRQAVARAVSLGILPIPP